MKEHMRVWLLASELMSHGGMQAYMFRIWEVLCGAPWVAAACASLNDSTHDMAAAGRFAHATAFWGARRDKIRFALGCARHLTGYSIAIVGLPAIATVPYVLKKLRLVRDYVVVIHGIEAWRRMPWLDRAALRSARAIVATTRYSAEVCATANDLPLGKFVVIPLCADESEVAPSADFSLGEAFNVLVVGRQARTEQYKGFEALFGAVKLLLEKHVNVVLHLIGAGDDQPRLKALTAELGVSANVIFWGRVRDDELRAAYQQCDVFAMPSAKEGFGIVFLEAMRHAKPCIGGNHGGTPEVISDGDSGFLVQHGDVPALAEVLERLYMQPALREKIGRAGQARLQEEFSFAAFSSAWRANLMKWQTERHEVTNG